MKKRLLSAAALVFALMFALSLPISAAKTYQTYTYSQNGDVLYSPDAYTAYAVMNANDLGLTSSIKECTDIFVDGSDNVYIADPNHKRIVVLDKYFNFKFEISSFINGEGVADSLVEPTGLYVTEKTDYNPPYIYVCDKKNSRIVVFNIDGSFSRIIYQPEHSLLGDDFVYSPEQLAVDDYGKLFVVSSGSDEGIMVMNGDGTFIRFVGAQKVTITAWEKIWRRFQTEEQRAASEQKTGGVFNNITIDEDGFIYVTTSDIGDDDNGNAQMNAVTNKDKSGDYAPVKKINIAGDEVLSRNGFWPPSGEVNMTVVDKNEMQKKMPSTIVDVALGPQGTWSIADQSRQRIFTYDSNGNLLFAFGDSGEQLGNLSSIAGIAYMSDGTLLALDKESFAIYKRTEYGDILIRAITNQNERQYDKAIEDWQEILKRNSNFDVAYVGLGNAYYRNGGEGDYEKAQEYFEAAYETDGWSKAYSELRKDWIEKYVLLIPVIVGVIIVALVLFFKKAAKINKRAATAGGKRTFVEELLFGFHLIFHPFDGFWDLKHEKRGSVRAAIVYVIVAILTFFYQAVGSGYLVNPTGTYTTIFAQALGVLVPLALWVVANWCLTTLFEGEGSLKDIFVATSYSLLPLPLLIIPITIYSNFATLEEIDLVSFIGTIAFIWVGMLLFVGTMVTHDYNMSKNFLMVLSTLVGMAFIMFLVILFSTLVGKMVNFVVNIVTEVGYH